MGIIGGLDAHRAHITLAYIYIESDSGEITRGRIRPALREDVRAWAERVRDRSDVAFALEGTSGWLHVVEELQQSGIAPADQAPRCCRPGTR